MECKDQKQCLTGTKLGFDPLSVHGIQYFLGI